MCLRTLTHQRQHVRVCLDSRHTPHIDLGRKGLMMGPSYRQQLYYICPPTRHFDCWGCASLCMQICAISTWLCSLDLRKRVSDGRETNQRRKSHPKERIKMCMSTSSLFRPSRTRFLLHVDVWNGGSTIQFRPKKKSE